MSEANGCMLELESLFVMPSDASHAEALRSFVCDLANTHNWNSRSRKIQRDSGSCSCIVDVIKLTEIASNLTKSASDDLYIDHLSRTEESSGSDDGYIDRQMGITQADCAVLLSDISIQIEFLWRRRLTFVSVDIVDVKRINGCYVITNGTKIIPFDPITKWCNAYCPYNMGPFPAPETSKHNKLPCNNFCHKNSVLHSLGCLGLELLFPTFDVKHIHQSKLELIDILGPTTLGVIVRSLVHEDPNKRLPVVI